MRYLATGFLFLLVLSTAACTRVDSGPNWADVQTSGQGTLRVLYVPDDGFAYEDDMGNLTGVTIEIVGDMAQWIRGQYNIQLDVDFVAEPDWRRFYSRVRNGYGGLFGIGNVTITEQRRHELHFSPPYLTNVAVLITHSGMNELQQLSDLGEAFRELRPLAFEGTLHEDRLANLRSHYHRSAEMVYASSEEEILERVAQGGFYAYVDGYNFWRALDREIPIMRHPVGDDQAEEFGIIFPLGSDWGRLIEEFFQANGGYLQTERYRDILSTHLGETVAATLLGE